MLKSTFEHSTQAPSIVGTSSSLSQGTFKTSYSNDALQKVSLLLLLFYVGKKNIYFVYKNANKNVALKG
ncbi:hypothetical protein L1987_67175 [Smallanthus sonchifolius]|uniref:Uncharacterized protein n=1 Tax=Smallanthus sonchifolius TaxID=185202 RepID=A0ACB9BZC9_9ASTR|nr:hypothetical protein L1987_67175 [Smallanthus sonchifolius]